MKSKHLVVLLTLLTTGGLAFAATSLSVIEFLKAVQVNTTQMPTGWVRWQTTVVSDRGCAWVDFTRINETPKIGWKSAWDFINQDLIPTFGNPPITAAQEDFCWKDIAPIAFVVAKNGTTLTRPIFDGDLWLATRDTASQWKQTGRVDVGVACEKEVIRKTTYNYHWTTNSSGLRGLTVCEVKK